MFYSIANLYPAQTMGGYGFSIRLWPLFQQGVKQVDLTQENINKAIENFGRGWLDSCGYSTMVDPDRELKFGDTLDRNGKKPLGPKAYHLYQPREIRVSWGEWGPEHITVPGNACGLDIDKSFGSPKHGAQLLPHNIDCWNQVNLILIVFTFFADNIARSLEVGRCPY